MRKLYISLVYFGLSCLNAFATSGPSTSDSTSTYYDAPELSPKSLSVAMIVLFTGIIMMTERKKADGTRH